MESAESIPREKLIEEIGTLKGVVNEQAREIEKLHLLLIQANKRQFGRKSEKLPSPAEQPALFSFDSPVVNTGQDPPLNADVC